MGKPIVSYLQRLAASIHPHVQLPLTSRDSQRLLALLDKELQKQLDLKHPPPPSPLQQPSPSITLAQIASHQSQSGDKVHKSPRTSKESSNRSPYHATSDHLASILSNPLFTPHRSITDEARGSHAYSKRTDVVAWFIGKVATGSADLGVAKDCLTTMLAQVKQLPVSERRRILKDSDLGWHVWDWLRSSGQDGLSAWKQDSSFCYYLSKCLVAAERTDIVLEWLQQRVPPNLPDKPLVKWQQAIAKGYVSTQYTDFGLNGALIAFKDIVALHARSEASSTESGLTKDASSPFLEFESIGRRILKAVMARKHDASVKPETFDLLLRSLDSVDGGARFLAAFLDIYHPVTPNTSRLLLLLRRPHPDSTDRSLPVPRGSSKWRTLSMTACLDAAELCFSQQNFKHGSRILASVKSSLNPIQTTSPQSIAFLEPDELQAGIIHSRELSFG